MVVVGSTKVGTVLLDHRNGQESEPCRSVLASFRGRWVKRIHHQTVTKHKAYKTSERK